MSENREYITQEQDNGTVIISEEVVAAIATVAIADVEGVAGLNTKTGSDIMEIIGVKGVKDWSRGLKVTISEDNELNIDCDINVKYGQVVVDVAVAAQSAIVSAVESMTGIRPAAVNINVCNIVR